MLRVGRSMPFVKHRRFRIPTSGAAEAARERGRRLADEVARELGLLDDSGSSSNADYQQHQPPRNPASPPQETTKVAAARLVPSVALLPVLPKAIYSSGSIARTAQLSRIAPPLPLLLPRTPDWTDATGSISDFQPLENLGRVRPVVRTDAHPEFGLEAAPSDVARSSADCPERIGTKGSESADCPERIPYRHQGQQVRRLSRGRPWPRGTCRLRARR